MSPTKRWRSSTGATKDQLILGIDPGIANVGYACLQVKDGRFSLLEADVLTTKKGITSDRLRIIFDFFNQKISEQAFTSLAMEKIYFNKNVKTALTIEEVRGVLLLTGSMHRLQIGQYTPLEVKKVLTEFGRAEKTEVKWMAEKILQCELPSSDDACDAVGVALCHYFNGKSEDGSDDLFG